MTVEVRFPGGRWRWLALASPVLGFVALSCRVGYDLVPQGALADGGAAGGSAAAPAGGFAGDVAAGASAGTASGASGGSAGDASAGSGSGGVVGDAGAGGGGGDGGLMAGAGAGGSSGAGAGGSSGAGAGGSSGSSGAGGSAGSSGAGGSAGGGGCGAPANCSCQSFGTHAYWFCSTATMRDAAQAICVGGGLGLVRIDDSGEDAWILSTALSLGMISSTGIPSDFLFTGANDSVALDNWQWQDGTQFWTGGSSGSAVGGLYSNWANSNPQSSSTRRCAGVFYTGVWQSRSCTALQPFVCEGP